MNLKNIIKKSLKNLEYIYRKELTLIDSKIEESNYLEGELRIKLDFAFINELLPILNKIYKARGWKNVNIYNDYDGKFICTIVKLNYE